MKRKVILIGLVSLLLTGCASEDNNTRSVNGTLRFSYIQELPDGRSVICVGATYALSCDWDNAR